MKTRAAFLALLIVALGVSRPGAAGADAQPAAPGADETRLQQLLTRLEDTVRTADAEAYAALLAPAADRDKAQAFRAGEIRAPALRAALRERDRAPLANVAPNAGFRVIVDVFAEFGNRARVATWRIDVVRAAGGEWRLLEQERLSSVESIHRLTLAATRHFDARDFSVRAEDFVLTLERGSVFTLEAEGDPTGLVLIGQGVMRFDPAPETEKLQLRLLSGEDRLEARFDAAFVRVGHFKGRADSARLTPREANATELRRAEEVFRTESPKSLTIDLGDLSRENWSLLPGLGDLVAEVRTRRFGTLTYTQSSGLPEDISLFDRERQRNIALYTSAARLAARGRSYSDDELIEYDILDYDIDARVTPERRFLDARARLRIKVRASSVSQLALRLSEPLVVRSIVSEPFGRLFGLRVRGQNLVIVNLPAVVLRDTEFTVTVVYSGRITPQPADREALLLPPQLELSDLEVHHLLSNRSLWYPQSNFTDYATARMRVTVPAAYDCLASGVRESEERSPSTVELQQRTISFVTPSPVRYLSLIVGRFLRVRQTALPLGDSTLDLTIYASPSQLSYGERVGARAADIVRFYHSTLGDAPFPALSVTVIAGRAPGGHSPGYFAVLSQPAIDAPRIWRNDPAAFDGQPDFFLAHEIAHQWFGQAVGWRNYHEQWVSEGFAQYLAALYIRHRRGPDHFDDMMKTMRRWALEQSGQGPIALGYRLGQIRNDSRVFRALVYNKGAVVLDMLRQITGDEVFFAGLRRFYAASRFRKVGTEEFQRSMEAASGRGLQQFFEGWIYGVSIPTLAVSHRVEPSVEGPELLIRIEHARDILDVPVTLTIRYADRSTAEIVVPVTDRIVETRVPLTGVFRALEFDRNGGTLAVVDRK
jgi:hypothetical protein